MKYNIKYSFFLMLSLCACAGGQKCVQYLQCPDGMNQCRQDAKDTCPSGYQTLSDSDVGADFASFAAANFPGASSGAPHMVVTCD